MNEQQYYIVHKDTEVVPNELIDDLNEIRTLTGETGPDTVAGVERTSSSQAESVLATGAQAEEWKAAHGALTATVKAALDELDETRRIHEAAQQAAQQAAVAKIRAAKTKYQPVQEEIDRRLEQSQELIDAEQNRLTKAWVEENPDLLVSHWIVYSPSPKRSRRKDAMRQTVHRADCSFVDRRIADLEPYEANSTGLTKPLTLDEAWKMIVKGVPELRYAGKFAGYVEGRRLAPKLCQVCKAEAALSNVKGAEFNEWYACAGERVM